MRVDYIYSEEIEEKVLEVHDILRILGTLQMVTKCKNGRFYLENLSGENNYLFDKLRINKDEFSQKFYNHYAYGLFAVEADNLELLTNSTLFLMEVAEKVNK